MISDADLATWLRDLDDELLDDVRRGIDKDVVLKGGGVRRAGRGRPRRTRVRLWVRAYWRDTLCIVGMLAGGVWLLLMAFDVRVGWFS